MSRIQESLSSLVAGVQRLLPGVGKSKRKGARQESGRQDKAKAKPKKPMRWRWSDKLAKLLQPSLEASKPKAPLKRLWLKRKLRGLKARYVSFRNTLSRRIYWVIVVAVVTALIGAGIVGYKLWNQAQIRKETLATVNAEPITRADLASEVVSAGVDYRQLDAKGRKQILDRIIERRLLLDVARKQGILTDARSASLRARADEMFLANLVMQRFAGTPPPPPSDEDARRYMAARPGMFAERQTFVIDGIICVLTSMPTSADVVFDTLDRAEDFLRQTKVQYRRRVQALDSADIPPAVATALATMAPDKVFALPRGRVTLIGTVQRRFAANTPPELQLEAAREILAKQRIEERLTKALAELRARAAIKYTAP